MKAHQMYLRQLRIVMSIIILAQIHQLMELFIVLVRMPKLLLLIVESHLNMVTMYLIMVFNLEHLIKTRIRREVQTILSLHFLRL